MPFNRFIAKTRTFIAGLMLLVFGVTMTAFGGALPAQAQVSTIESGTLNATAVTGAVKQNFTDILTTAAVSALVNSANYFASQIAYSAAVSIASDCPGQKNCWNSIPQALGLKQAAEGAVGEAVGSLSQGLLGSNRLCSPGKFSITLSLGLLRDLKPPVPKCSFSTITSSWGALISSVKSGDILNQLTPVFRVGNSPPAIALDVLDGMTGIRADARLNYTVAQLKTSGGGGFSSIIDPVSERIKSPQAVVAAEFDTLHRAKNDDPKQATASANAGAIARGAVTTVALNAAQTFGQTLVSRLWNKLVNGLLSTEQLIANQPELVIDPEAALNPGATSVGQSLQTHFVTAAARDSGTFDPLLDFSSCPGDGASPNNCVMDAQFANAVRLGDTSPLTVAEAIKKGMLHKDWPMYSSASSPEKDRDNFCYTAGYCESNLKKLRASRVIPVGWELAAAQSSPNAPISLGEVVAKFNDCNATGGSDAQHPWCHLIDPNWVLKAPPAQCRAEVFGPTLVSANAGSRGKTCADVQTCLRQDDLGNCIGGWGYCTRERSVWRFQGDQCPAQYASCRTLTPRVGKPISLLENTIDPGVCNADNVGCQAYYEDAVRGQDPTSTGGWDKNGDTRFFNKNVQTCSSAMDGCSAVVPLASGQSLNLVRNGGFEVMDDGDGDGTPDHAAWWFPYGVSPSSDNGTQIASGFVESTGTYAADGSRAIALGRNMGVSTLQQSDTCTNFVACAQPGGCTCDSNSNRDYLDGYSCLVAYGRTTCTVTSRVMQTDIPVRTSATYTAGVTFTSGKADVRGFYHIEFYDKGGRAMTLGSGDVTTLPADFTGGTGNPVANGDCDLVTNGAPTGSIVAVEFTGTKAAKSRGVRAACTFQVKNASIAKMSIELGAYGDADGTTDKTTVTYADDVQIEEGGTATAFHDQYNAGTQQDLKLAPDYLHCTGEASDAQECANYAGFCRENEVGCDSYAPLNGDPSVPAIAGPQDACPSQCAGYDTFKQEATGFDGEKFPVFFIPSTATQCSAAESGCSEFTDVATEKRSYFSALRSCEKPSNDPDTVFYSWEGSDTTGFQLKVWNLKKSAATVGSSVNDVTANGAAGNAGFAPCTRMDGKTGACLSKDTGAGTDMTGICTRDDVDGGNFDCREFYDAAGNRHYRLYSKTVVLSAACTDYRITASTLDDCDKSNGKWNAAQGQCVYAADAGLSQQCSDKASGCRPYKGNAAGNERAVVSDTFESGTGNWQGGAQSPESVVVGGHSIKISGTGAIARDVSGLVAEGRSYSILFWARGSGAVSVAFAGSKDIAFPVPATAGTLTTDWKQYAFGPVNAPVNQSPAWGTNVQLLMKKSGGTDAFFDNVTLKEVQDNIYVVRDSWKTPLACDQTADGAPSPQEMLGCKAYVTPDGNAKTLRSFSNLCREKAIGCQAFSDTRNSVADPYAHTWNAVCTLPAACAGGNCPCDYDVKNVIASESGLPPVVLGDVCRVPKGETTCRFESDRMTDPDMAAGNADVVALSADRKLYLVPSATAACTAEAIGCTATGVEKQTFEKVCTLTPNANGAAANGICGNNSCTCTVSGVNCTVARGAKTCTATFNAAQNDGFTPKAVRDLPSTYGTTLCLANAQRCEAFSASDGALYFKNPGNQTCQYKEGVSIGGQQRSGWFRTSASGADVPCYANLLKNGETYDIAKNDDPAFSAVGGGWAGLCAPDSDRCTEFTDPAQTSAANPDGQPYYYLMNNKIDLQSCGGSASLENGCVLFNRADDTVKRFATYATYQKSNHDVSGGKVAPVDCDADPRAAECEKRCSGVMNGMCVSGNGSGSHVPCGGDGQCANGESCKGDITYGSGCSADADCNGGKGESCVTVTDVCVGGARNGQACSGQPGNFCSGGQCVHDLSKNDTNLVIKVRRDRECAEWLQCDATESVWDASLGKWKSVCISVDSCQEQRKVGESQECGVWSTDPLVKLDQQAYASRDVTYAGLEYSGYSLPGKYPVQYVALAKNDDNPSKRLYGVATDPSKRCKVDGDCATGQVCGGGLCYGDLAGGPITGATDNASQCRGYPEEDAPYNAKDVATGFDSAGQPTQFKSAFKSANFCQPGFDCDCSYTRYGYGKGGLTTRFYSTIHDDGVAVEPNICVGGPNEGKKCSMDKVKDDCVQADGGVCSAATKSTSVLGWEGLCLDPDSSFSVGGDANRFACNLWYPVDRISGAEDLNQQNRSAGFAPIDTDYVYCAVAAGNKDADGDYAKIIVDQWNFSGQRGDGSPANGWFRNSNMELQTNTIVYNSSPVITKDQIADLHLRIDAGFSNEALGEGSLLDLRLTEQNGWQFAWTYNDSKTVHSKPEPGTKYKSNMNLGDCEWGAAPVSNAGDDNDPAHLCVRAKWSNNKLVGFDVVSLNHDDVCGGAFGNDCPNFVVQLDADFRETCSTIALVNDKANTELPSVAWTDRLRRGLALPGFDLAHDSQRAFVQDQKTPVSQNPFGRITAATDSVTSSVITFVTGDASSKDKGDYPLPIWESDGGSDFVNATTKYDANTGNDASFQFDSGNTGAGIPYACTGDCGSGKDGLYKAPDEWKKQGFAADDMAKKNLGQLFVVGWGLYGADFDGTSRIAKNTYSTAKDNADHFRSSDALTGWDSRADWVTLDTAPVVHPVNTSACAGTVGCPEGSQNGISVNGLTSGNVSGTGRLRAVIGFYASADPNHMPIRKKYVDFGDQSDPIDAPGFYKNHRGCVTDPKTGQCNGQSPCNDPSNEDGRTQDSCETDYFSVNKVYSCSAALLSSLPFCGPSQGYPCKSGNSCVFQPRVRIVDNWGQCNGRCQGGPNGTCLNADPRNFDSGGSCSSPYNSDDPKSWQSWTPFAGEIVVKVAP